MAAKLFAHLRQQWMGAIALFLVLTGGTAYALAGSNTVFTDDIVNGEVKVTDIGQGAVATDEIANGQVSTADIGGGEVRSGSVANDNLTGGDVAPNSLKGSDIDESTLSSIGGGGPAGGDLTGTYPNPAIRSNAVGTGKVADNALTGADINEPTLGQVPSALLGGFGRSGSVVSCDPEGTAFTPCAGTEVLSVPAGARALVLGRARAFVDGDSFAGSGTCRLTASSIGAIPGSDMTFGPDDDQNYSENGTLFVISPPLPAGATSFGIECNDDAPVVNLGVNFREVAAGVVLISDA